MIANIDQAVDGDHPPGLYWMEATPLGMGFSHRGHRGHREILSFAIDEAACTSAALLSDGKGLLLCGRNYLTRGCPQR
jgi:hypothetical protein